MNTANLRQMAIELGLTVTADVTSDGEGLIYVPGFRDKYGSWLNEKDLRKYKSDLNHRNKKNNLREHSYNQ